MACESGAVEKGKPMAAGAATGGSIPAAPPAPPTSGGGFGGSCGGNGGSGEARAQAPTRHRDVQEKRAEAAVPPPAPAADDGALAELTPDSLREAAMGTLSPENTIRSVAERVVMRWIREMPEKMVDASLELLGSDPNPMVLQIVALLLRKLARDVESWNRLDAGVRAVTMQRLMIVASDGSNRMAQRIVCSGLGAIVSAALQAGSVGTLSDVVTFGDGEPSAVTIRVVAATLEALDDGGDVPPECKEEADEIVAGFVSALPTDAEPRLLTVIADLYAALTELPDLFLEPRVQESVLPRLCTMARHEIDEVARSGVLVMGCMAERHYTLLGPYMDDWVEVTFEAIANREGEVAMQAFEFWSVIAESEVDRLDSGAADDTPYCTRALTQLPSMLGSAMMTQVSEELEDDDEWDRCKASAVCLGLLAKAVRDAIVPAVLPFVRSSVDDAENWRARDAALVAIGSISSEECQLPSDAVLEVIAFLPRITRLASSAVVPVEQHSALWALGRMMSAFHEEISNQSEHANDLGVMAALEAGLSSAVPALVHEAAGAVHAIVDKLQVHAESGAGDEVFSKTGLSLPQLVTMVWSAYHKGAHLPPKTTFVLCDALAMLFRVVEGTLPESVQSDLLALLRMSDAEAMLRVAESNDPLCGIAGLVNALLESEFLHTAPADTAGTIVSFLGTVLRVKVARGVYSEELVDAMALAAAMLSGPAEDAMLTPAEISDLHRFVCDCFVMMCESGDQSVAAAACEAVADVLMGDTLPYAHAKELGLIDKVVGARNSSNAEVAIVAALAMGNVLLAGVEDERDVLEVVRAMDFQELGARVEEAPDAEEAAVMWIEAGSMVCHVEQVSHGIVSADLAAVIKPMVTQFKSLCETYCHPMATDELWRAVIGMVGDLYGLDALFGVRAIMPESEALELLDTGMAAVGHDESMVELFDLARLRVPASS